ncbi:hypothetical protein [Sporosarcina globispora]|nr:hypothetical protein [Sporosarcina globispora]
MAFGFSSMVLAVATIGTGLELDKDNPVSMKKMRQIALPHPFVNLIFL